MLNLLIVEDVRFVRLGIKSSIERKEIMVYQSDTYNSAINILKQKRIDILLLDLNLETLSYMDSSSTYSKSGIDILDYIVNNNMDMPYVIIISGNLDQSNVMKVYRYNIGKILSKPYTVEDLKREVERAIIERTKLLAGL